MVITQEIKDHYAIYNSDCIEVMSSMKPESIHLSVYSPPFGGLYHYSSNERDLSNAYDYEEFMKWYEFVISEIHRITLPGRISYVHCMDVPMKGANICGYTDFPGDIIRLHQKIGFDYLPRYSIWKEPLAVRNRTMSKALAHKQIVEDSTLTNCAASDYLIPFRKHGANPIPVVHPTGLQDYAGDATIPGELLKFKNYKGNQIQNKYSHWIWRQYASSHWYDIRLGRVLPFKESKDPDDEKHVHPLQLDVIERAVILSSNPDEIVFTPFAGVGSEAYGALINGRKAIAVELKPSYYKQMKKNLESVKFGEHKKETVQTSLVEL